MIARTVATLTFATLSLSAFAQFGTWGHNNDTRTWHPPGVVVNQQGGSFVSGAPIANSAILAAQPVYFTSMQASNFTVLPNNQFGYAGATYRCPAVSKWLGAFGGAVVGHVIGKNINTHGHNLGGGGTVLGAYAGQEIACEMVQPAQLVAVHPAPQAPAGQVRPSAVTVHVPQNVTRHTCMVGSYIIDVAPHQDCRNLTAAVNSVTQGNGQQPQPVAAPQHQPEQTAATQSQQHSGSNVAPVQKNGQTCALLTKSGLTAMDFLSEDKTLNPLPAPVQTGEQCRTAKQRYAAG